MWGIPYCFLEGDDVPQTGWLIEKNNGSTTWLMLENGRASWTSNSAEALRFSREQDGDRFAQYYLGMPRLPKGYSVTSHSWG